MANNGTSGATSSALHYMIGNLRISRLVIAALLGALPHGAYAGIGFVDVSDSAGFSNSGTETWGGAWGDLNGDGYPDLFSTNHRNRATLFRNNANGTFSEVSSEVDLSGTAGWTGGRSNVDMHGASWADIDNDGDDDLWIVVSSDVDVLFTNDGGFMTDSSTALNVTDLGHFAGRMPLLFDYTGDGRLDMMAAALGVNGFPEYGPALYPQRSNGTFDDSLRINLDCGDGAFAHLADVAPNAGLELLCGPRNGDYPSRVYAFSSGSVIDVSSSVPKVSRVNDAITADFNGDLRPDLFLVIGAPRPSDAVQVNSKRIETQLITNAGNTKITSFKTTGNLTISVDMRAGAPTNGDPRYIDIGSGGWSPSSLTFSLDPNASQNHGIRSDARGLNIGYDPATNIWQILQNGDEYKTAFVIVESSQQITDLTFAGALKSDLPDKPRLLLSSPSGYVDATAASGLDEEVLCVSAAAGDFDNDMDEDIFLACTGGSHNIPNIVYENLGNGSFRKVASAGGAAGFVGAAVGDGVGTSENVVLADYNIDGFLDALVTNGSNMRPQEYGGPKQLFRNSGNNNHWLLLDLEGVTSNRDGIGATIRVTAGSTTQYREQNRGYHKWAHHHKRAHVGLGSHTSASIRIEWPSGVVDQHNDVAADKLYRAVEGGAIEVIDIGGGGGSGPPPSCGDPNYDSAADRAVFVWEDCQGMWHMRATAAGGFTRYQGNVTSDQGFTIVAPHSIESSDVFDTSSDPNAITFDLRVGPPYEDGFDFDFPDGSNVCFTVDAPSNATVLVGADRTPVNGAFDPQTLQACTASTQPTLSIDDVSVPEAGGPASFTVSLFPESGQTVTVDYATANGSATAGSDYAATSGTLTFSPGESSQSIDVSILDDGDSEGNEQFTVELSNASNAALGDASGTGTIVDDEVSACGMPSYDPSADHGVFVWQDCATGAWSARFVAGNGFTRYQGMVDSSLGMDVTRVSIESNDVVDTSNSNQALYDLRVSPMWEDGFDFSYPSGSNVCFTVSAPTDATVRVGPDRTPVEQPFDPDTLGPCGSGGSQPALSIDDVSVAEASGPASFTVNLSPSAPDPVTVDYTTVAGTATAGSDYTGTSGTLMFSPGETSQSIDVTILDDGDSEGNEQFTVELSNASNAVLGDASGTGTIVDNEVSACGMPSYDSNVDHAVLVWQDCPGGAWHARFVAGNGFTRYIGSVASDQAFSMVSPYSIESSDVFDTSDPSTINYDLRVSPKWEDGFDFSYPAGANVCFGISAPGNAPVLIGSGRATISQPFNPDTLESC